MGFSFTYQCHDVGSAAARCFMEINRRVAGGQSIEVFSRGSLLKGEAPRNHDYQSEFPDLDLATNIRILVEA